MSDKKKILVNAIQCKICKDVITSRHVHDFRKCTCGNVFVDGGKEYLRRGWENSSAGGELPYVEMAEYAD